MYPIATCQQRLKLTATRIILP